MSKVLYDEEALWELIHKYEWADTREEHIEWKDKIHKLIESEIKSNVKEAVEKVKLFEPGKIVTFNIMDSAADGYQKATKELESIKDEVKKEWGI